MTLVELFNKRRSIRKFQKKAVSLETIEDLINDSILAPSAGNEQSWEFIIVNNREMIKRISTECKQNMLVRIAHNPNFFAKCLLR